MIRITTEATTADLFVIVFFPTRSQFCRQSCEPTPAAIVVVRQVIEAPPPALRTSQGERSVTRGSWEGTWLRVTQFWWQTQPIPPARMHDHNQVSHPTDDVSSFSG